MPKRAMAGDVLSKDEKKLSMDAMSVRYLSDQDVEHDEFETRLAAKASASDLKEFAKLNGTPAVGDKATIAQGIAESLKPADLQTGIEVLTQCFHGNLHVEEQICFFGAHAGTRNSFHYHPTCARHRFCHHSS